MEFSVELVVGPRFGSKVILNSDTSVAFPILCSIRRAPRTSRKLTTEFDRLLDTSAEKVLLSSIRLKIITVDTAMSSIKSTSHQASY